MTDGRAPVGRRVAKYAWALAWAAVAAAVLGGMWAARRNAPTSTDRRLARLVAESPFRNVGPGVAYVGDAACAVPRRCGRVVSSAPDGPIRLDGRRAQGRSADHGSGRGGVRRHWVPLHRRTAGTPARPPRREARRQRGRRLRRGCGRLRPRLGRAGVIPSSWSATGSSPSPRSPGMLNSGATTSLPAMTTGISTSSG